MDTKKQNPPTQDFEHSGRLRLMAFFIFYRSKINSKVIKKATYVEKL